MALLLNATPIRSAGYSLLVADPEQVVAAQRLRYQVFAEEVGATLRSPVAGLDIDEFDEHCDHLIVCEDATGEVVGTYRMLPPGRVARRYGDGEFDLGAIEPLRDLLVETGRSCVRADHRDGAVINLMWAGIAQYMTRGGYRWLGGCASVPLADGGATAARVWNLVERKHLSPPDMRVRPLRPWLAESTVPAAPAEARLPVPPLLRGYLRLGAWICGEPAFDPDFNCVDLYVLLSLDRVDPRYMRHFLSGISEAGPAGDADAATAPGDGDAAGPTVITEPGMTGPQMPGGADGSGR